MVSLSAANQGSISNLAAWARPTGLERDEPMKTRRVRPLCSDGDKGEALDQCQRLSGREMRRSMVPRWQDQGYV